jgi:hypothetical protein
MSYLWGRTRTTNAGAVVAPGGDVNGDGFQDLLVGPMGAHDPDGDLFGKNARINPGA